MSASGRPVNRFLTACVPAMPMSAALPSGAPSIALALLAPASAGPLRNHGCAALTARSACPPAVSGCGGFFSGAGFRLALIWEAMCCASSLSPALSAAARSLIISCSLGIEAVLLSQGISVIGRLLTELLMLHPPLYPVALIPDTLHLTLRVRLERGNHRGAGLVVVAGSDQTLCILARPFGEARTHLRALHDPGVVHRHRHRRRQVRGCRRIIELLLDPQHDIVHRLDVGEIHLAEFRPECLEAFRVELRRFTLGARVPRLHVVVDRRQRTLDRVELLSLERKRLSVGLVFGALVDEILGIHAEIDGNLTDSLHHLIVLVLPPAGALAIGENTLLDVVPCLSIECNVFGGTLFRCPRSSRGTAAATTSPALALRGQVIHPRLEDLARLGRESRVLQILRDLLRLAHPATAPLGEDPSARSVLGRCRGLLDRFVFLQLLEPRLPLRLDQRHHPLDRPPLGAGILDPLLHHRRDRARYPVPALRRGWGSDRGGTGRRGTTGRDSTTSRTPAELTTGDRRH